MLAADKDRLVARLKQNALTLRQKELEYYVERYSNITTQASILAGFAFDSLVELDITEAMEQTLTDRGLHWMQTAYYISASMTMAFALYTLCVSAFATVYGHRLALQGPTGSVERAVAVMMKQRALIFAAYGLAMVCLVAAAIFMAFIKMGDAAGGVSGVFGVFFLCLLWKHQEMKRMFHIDRERMVQGDVRVNVGATEVDIATLEAGFGAGNVGATLGDSGAGAVRGAGGGGGGGAAAPPLPASATAPACSEPLLPVTTARSR